MESIRNLVDSAEMCQHTGGRILFLSVFVILGLISAYVTSSDAPTSLPITRMFAFFLCALASFSSTRALRVAYAGFLATLDQLLLRVSIASIVSTSAR